MSAWDFSVGQPCPQLAGIQEGFGSKMDLDENVAAAGVLKTASSHPYDASYYSTHCGSVSYARNDHWLGVFGKVADEMVRAFAPRRVFDAGCALGMLVESFWDRGVIAYGRDISEFAISHVRPDIRRFCEVGSICDKIEGIYDLITCIEVLEHISEAEALQAIENIANSTSRVLFSSSPIDFDEPTHINIRPTAYWLARWADAGFAPNVTHDAGYLAPHAYVLERTEEGHNERDLAIFADRVRHRVAMSQLGSALEVAHASESKMRIALEAARVAESEAKRQADALSEALSQERDVATADREAAATALELADSALAALRVETEAALAAVRVETEAALAAVRIETEAAQHAAEMQLQDAVARARVDEQYAMVPERERLVEELRQHSTQVHDLQIGMRDLQAKYNAIAGSTIWRMTWPIRITLAAIPASARQTLRKIARLGWWTLTFQLRRKLRERADVMQLTKLVRESPHFDAQWYLSHNSDVAASGLDAALHYATIGGKQGRDPGPAVSISTWTKAYPDVAAAPGGLALLHYDAVVRARGPVPGHAPAPEPGTLAQSEPFPQSAQGTLPTAETLLRGRFGGLEALRTYAAEHHSNRVTVVTDSVNAGSLYGGVGTALILGALLAKRLGASLRLVTRTEVPNAANIDTVLRVHGIDWDDNIELLHSPPGGGLDVPISERDLMLTTSWWTTWSTRQAVASKQIVYLLQEDERMFYPLGDDHLRCSETMSDPRLRFVVNSDRLLRHLQSEKMAPAGCSFEPAFPTATPPDTTTNGVKSRFNLFFYSRPHNARNLYWRGLEAISSAIEQGLFDPARWDIYFVGHGTQDLILPRGIRPKLVQNLAWSDYANLVRTMDVGLSLMYTPHSSYPPLDLVGSGAVVVTNRFGPKIDFDDVSRNIICVDTSVEALVDGLRKAVELAQDTQQRTTNIANTRLPRDWASTLATVVDKIADAMPQCVQGN